jgi:hypothetical protein
MTKQQRKALLIFIGIVVASYIVRTVAIDVLQMRYYQQQAMRAAQQKAKAKPKPVPPAVKTAAPPRIAARPKAAPPPRPTKPQPSPYAKLSGIWQGRAAIDGRGICDVKFELREKESSGHFSGYSTMTCTAAGPLVGKRLNPRLLTLNRMDPEAAILSGRMESGSVLFRADKTVGADANGCAVTSFSLTPFGSNQLAAEWQEDTCAGGHTLLRKVR